MKRRYLFGAALVASIVLSAGCQNNTTDSSFTIPKVNSNEVRLEKADALEIVQANRRYKVAVLFPFQGIPFWTNEAYGIFDQADKNGVDIIWRSADGYQNVERQVEQISEMKALGVDAVILGATNFAGTRAAAEDLILSGIPVINHVTSTNSDMISAKVLVDYVEIGRKQAQHIKEVLPKGGTIIMLNGPSGAEWSGNEVKGFKEVIGDDPRWEIVAERNSNPERVSAQKNIEDLLVRFPNVSAIFSVTDSLAMGALDALKGSGKAGDVIVTTAGFSPETVKPILEGNISLNVDESPVLIGRLAINAATKVLNGEEVPGVQFAPIPPHTKQSIDNLSLDVQWAPKEWILP